MVSLSQPSLWNGWARIGLFWGVVVVIFLGLAALLPWLDVGLIAGTLGETIAGDHSGISARAFAYALATALGAFAFALAMAFLVVHVVMTWLALKSVRRLLDSSADLKAFANDYDRARSHLEAHPLIGHAWQEFDETLVPPLEPGDCYQNTVRPQCFINMGMLRERLIGLKIMGSIPGYFVGIGLLLTFIGLVLALGKAAAAVNSDDAAGMQIATRELLEVATFKFATSIAGLGASIALSFLFKLYNVWIEQALDRFCKAVESKLTYVAPQAITAKMNATLGRQLDELKAINSEGFFARMGETVSPQIQTAVTTAMAPVTESINQTMGRLTDQSQSGMVDLVAKFSESLQESAGTEMQALAGTLNQMRNTLVETQRGIHGSGEQFSRRMTEAAENLNRLVSEAGANLGAGSEQSRAAVTEVMTALRETMDQANRKVEEELGQAASGASAKIEAAMGRILEELGGQVDTLRHGLGGFQGGLTQHLDETRKTIASAQEDAARTIGSASDEAARALRDGLGEALQTINREVTRFAASLSTAEQALAGQSQAFGKATAQSVAIADAFGAIAKKVQAAATPLAQSGERIAGATETMTAAIAQSAQALREGQASSRELANSLTRHNASLADSWERYRERFEAVDKSLGAAVAKLAEAAESQGQVLSHRVAAIDKGFAEAIDKLNPFLDSLTDSTDRLAEDVGELKGVFGSQAAE